MIEYAHLHCHTKYSIQDAMPNHKAYVDAISEENEKNQKYHCVGFAATDHGVIYGLAQQYNACNKPDHKERQTKAIYGCEVYHCIDVDNNPNKDRFHLVLLARNQVGLTNLYQIVSHAGMHIIKGKQKNFPVTDLKYMRQHGEGIIALTACLGGIIPNQIVNGNNAQALAYINDLKTIFDEVYLEVQPNNLPEQLMVNAELVNMSQITGCKLVMTSDSHYIKASDSQYHDILKSMCHQKPFNVNAHLYSPDEMEAYCLANNLPLECISNTAEVANKCNVDPKPKDSKALLPVYDCPPGYTEDSYLRKIAYEGLQKRMMDNNIPNPKKYLKQMAYELEVICGQGFASYFLILWDWFQWCRQNGILLGPGRGSAAGSIVSYALDITKVDPIKNGFYFERFLSPQRTELPDIDTDVPRDKRAEAIQYLKQKYGAENVSQIVTFGEYKLKNTIKAIMSALGCDFAESNEITRDIPDMVDGNAVTYDLIEDVALNPDKDKYASMSDREKQSLGKIYDKLKALFQKYPIVYSGVKQVCGCLASTGIHAGGVIISRKPINQHAAIIDGGDTAVLPLVQAEMTDLDFFGLLKYDMLGLKTLDVIKTTMDLAGLGYDWYDSEDYVDPAVYDMLRAGETTDVFQLSTFTPTSMLVDFNVTDIDGICAVNAGNRPGPLEKDKTTGKSMVDILAERTKTGVVESLHPDIDPILEKTMGCVWYQEHCINIGQVMAGYNLGNADSRIRKVLGKKLKKKIPEIRNEFIYGKTSVYDEDHNVIGIGEDPSPYCVGSLARGYSLELSEKMFDTMEAFAKYSFNRSHSFCYGVLAYKTAWLSYHYPAEFAVANCTINQDQEAITATLALAKKRKIAVLPPDINHSQVGFSLDNGAIRYGLKAIKGIGSSVLSFIDKYKQLDSIPFKSFDDYYNRIHDQNNPVVIQLMNDIRAQSGKQSPNPMKKDVEIALILSGAFDFDNPNRYELLYHYIVDIRKEKSVKAKGEDMSFVGKSHQEVAKTYKRKEKLALEKFYMGSYISEHPLDPFPYADFESANENEVIKTTGIVVSSTLKYTKTNKPFMSMKIKAKDDVERTVNVFNETIVESLKTTLKKNQIVIVVGRVSKKFNNINATQVSPVAFKKQTIDTEDLDIEEAEKKGPQLPPPVDPIGFGNIFGM